MMHHETQPRNQQDEVKRERPARERADRAGTLCLRGRGVISKEAGARADEGGAPEGQGQEDGAEDGLFGCESGSSIE